MILIPSLFQGFAPLYREFESFYHRNVYHRGSQLTAAPLAGVPGAEIEIIENIEIIIRQ